jgi:hypothetical protein
LSNHKKGAIFCLLAITIPPLNGARAAGYDNILKRRTPLTEHTFYCYYT